MKNKKLWRIGKEELKYIKEAIKGGLKGEFNKKLEEEFAKKFGVNFAVSVNSGNSALHCALYACGVKEGDEVIVPPLTFASPALTTLCLKAVPVFADVDPETFNIDPIDIERKITSKTKAIVTVSLYGLPTDIDKIMLIAKKNNLKVVEDNAECFMGKYQGRLAGTVGDMSIFSFERSKHLTCGSGGMIITNDEKLAEKTRKFSILGYSTLSAKQDSFKTSLDVVQHPSFKRHEILGFNYRLPEVCAAMVLAQLEKADKLIEMRQKIAELYSKAIEGCSWLVPQKTPAGFVNAYWTYVLKLDTSKVAWEKFRQTFLELGGERYYGTWSVNYLEPVFEGLEFPENNMKYEKGLCPVAEELQPRLIQLKTNFGDIKYAELQASILKRTIEKLD
ncbi:MAG: histidine kinase [Candidatus Nealsonbacteria bacterium RBG_13_38_11]|uniref:Histidine kinase n=1 Tax=Candidatus Nealsonbacteria bacterium RBG_13_38_11 TaxID=1801662 RepID=A0A1G2DXQ1_9BACT|nr:MAG: histidine kinase [Candidatus Nealsonbacteria bacterium RBG_13_38_11]